MKDCCKYTAGDLRARIVIERKSQVADGMGGNIETWTADPAGGVFAAWEPLMGREAVTYMRIAPSASVRAVIRFRGDDNGAPYYSGADRVTYRGRTYAIESVIDAGGEGQWLEVLLSEGKPS